MTLSTSSLDVINAHGEWRQHRVAKVTTPDGVLLVKGQRPGRGPGRFKLMAWLSLAAACARLRRRSCTKH
jgi:hypothetical protein